MIGKPNRSSIKTGSTNYLNENNKLKNNKHKLYKSISEGKYPNGIFPFVFLLILLITIFLIAFLTENKISDESGNYKIIKRTWYDSLWIASGVTFLLNLSWFILRRNFNANSRFNINKYAHKLKIDYFRFTQPRNNDDYSINRVSDIDEYKEYLNERVERTKTMFIISISIHSLIFVIATIINIVYMNK